MNCEDQNKEVKTRLEVRCSSCIRDVMLMLFVVLVMWLGKESSSGGGGGGGGLRGVRF